jgi:ATP-binding cassette subfamily F protein 3
MADKSPAAIRSQLGRFGFSGNRATTPVASLSGGERARLALALITRDAPHLLILDEPTNHLDVDSREALVQALNEYSGAVVIVSHDRHMIELVADRLVLVDGGTAKEFSGSLEDYTDIVLRKADGNEAAGGDAPKVDRKAEKRNAAEWREKQKAAKNALSKAEKEMAVLSAERSRIDQALFDPKSATGAEAKLTMTELMVKRSALEKKLETVEEAWMEASAALEEL